MKTVFKTLGIGLMHLCMPFIAVFSVLFGQNQGLSFVIFVCGLIGWAGGYILSFEEFLTQIPVLKDVIPVLGQQGTVILVAWVIAWFNSEVIFYSEDETVAKKPFLAIALMICFGFTFMSVGAIIGLGLGLLI